MKNTITECCPHCEHEVTLEWDVKNNGQVIRCPYCGKRMMLCSECEDCAESCTKCSFHPLTGTCHKMGKVHHTETAPRTVLVELEVDDNFAVNMDISPIDYLEDKMKMLNEDGIIIQNARVLDEGDTEDENAISMMNAIFNHDENL